MRTSSRARKMLKNESLVAKIGVDTAGNEPSKVFRKWEVRMEVPGGMKGREARARLHAGSRDQDCGVASVTFQKCMLDFCMSRKFCSSRKHSLL